MPAFSSGEQFGVTHVHMAMIRCSISIMLAIGAFLCYTLAVAQADGMVAYVPSKPLPRTADDGRIGFSEGAVDGKVEAILPVDAFQADILNVRGNVKRSYSTTELGSLSLGDLRPGTWTLRVHTPDGLRVRRFVIMERGKVVWSPTGVVKKRRHR